MSSIPPFARHATPPNEGETVTPSASVFARHTTVESKHTRAFPARMATQPCAPKPAPTFPARHVPANPGRKGPRLPSKPGARTAAPPPPDPSAGLKPSENCFRLARILDEYLKTDDKNPPLEQGHVRRFQLAWNNIRQRGATILPADGKLGRNTKLCLEFSLSNFGPKSAEKTE